MDIIIKKASEEDSGQIAELHRQYIPSGFLSSLGHGILTLIYKSMLTSKEAFCLVAKDNNRTVGFAAGAVTVRGFYKEFLRRHFLRGCLILLPEVLNPSAIKKIKETLSYPAKMQGTPDAELLSIVVDEEYQSMGISRKLLDGLALEFKRRGVERFKVVVGSGLKAACTFYEKNGGVLFSETEVHKGENSRVYVWQIRRLIH